MSVTLEQLLESRDRRRDRQTELIGQHPGKTLVCLTVVLPGPVKRDARSMKVAAAAVSAVRNILQPEWDDLLDLETGFEGYFIVDGSPTEVKRTCCFIEDTHPLGRLMDLDVVEAEGETVVPMGRDRVGLEARRCLVCGAPARDCMRNRKHTLDELLAKIDMILSFDENP